MPQENKNVAVSRAMGDGVQGALEVVCGVAVAPSLPVEDLRAVLSGLVVELDVGLHPLAFTKDRCMYLLLQQSSYPSE
ncbi:hypothetical protein D3C80_1042790 [compost metagenome]